MLMNLCFWYSNDKYCILEGQKELEEMDRLIKDNFKTEEQLRHFEKYAVLIQAFKRKNQSYCRTLPEWKKDGRILYLYQDRQERTSSPFHLKPLYGEDEKQSFTLSERKENLVTNLIEVRNPSLLSCTLKECGFLFHAELSPIEFSEFELCRSQIKNCTQKRYIEEENCPDSLQGYHRAYSRLIEMTKDLLEKDMKQDPSYAYFRIRKMEESVENYQKVVSKAQKIIPDRESIALKKGPEEEITIADPVDFFAKVRRQAEERQQRISEKLDHCQQEFLFSKSALVNQPVRFSDVVLDYYAYVDQQFPTSLEQETLFYTLEGTPSMLPGYVQAKLIGVVGQTGKTVLEKEREQGCVFVKKSSTRRE